MKKKKMKEVRKMENNDGKERKKIKIGNLYFYEDDLFNPLIYINGVYRNALFVRNTELKNILNQTEMDIVMLGREIHRRKKEMEEMIKTIDNIDEQRMKQNELDQLIQQYNTILDTLKQNEKSQTTQTETQNTENTVKQEKHEQEEKKDNNNEIPPEIPPGVVPIKKPSQNQNQIQKNETTKNFTVEKGYVSSIAQMYNIPPDIANMYFMLIDDQLYIKHQGLLFMASKKGYQRIEVESTWNDKDKTWYATAKVYPKLPLKVLEMLKDLPDDERKLIIDYMTKPTVANATANIDNVRNPRMHAYLKEMSETRAINRALRLYTGYGGTSYEELDNSELNDD